jgi:hypothetical protein
MALADLLGGAARAQAARPGEHFPARARSVIYLFMAGGPSQLELFDFKPRLQELDGQPVPASFLQGRRFAFMDSFTRDVPRLLGPRRRFARHGQSGTYVSEALPFTAGIVDDIAIVRSMKTEPINHAPALLFANTGSAQFGRPSMGSWVTYGLGSESRDLPGFVVLQSGQGAPSGGASNWGSGFLPAHHQGVPFRSGAAPILNVANPRGISPARQRQVLDALGDLNSAHLAETGDPEIATRIASYELAYRMQTSAPELMDISREPRRVLEGYGAQPGQRSFANNCLLARRLVERGVRFVQLYHTFWDHHGQANNDLNLPFTQICRETDQPAAALIRDLKERGLLEQTLVIWGGEFGRTPMSEVWEAVGRNHHVDAFTVWLAGGGIKSGAHLGGSDDLGFHAILDPVHMHDLQATVLHLLGLDHTRLTYRYQGRDFRLTDVSGEVVRKLLA